MKTKALTASPLATDGNVTPRYLRALLEGQPQTHVGKLQNACLCNAIRNAGRLEVSMGGNVYDVIPHPHNAQQFSLVPITTTINGKSGQSIAGLQVFSLSWGWKAFEAAILDGTISLDYRPAIGTAPSGTLAATCPA